MWPRPRLVAAAVAAAAAAFAASSALACSCVSFRSAADHLSRTDVVFKGRAIRTSASQQYQAATTFKVTEVLKGGRMGTVEVAHPKDVCCICGLSFAPGRTYLVFAHRGEKGLSTSSCSQGRFSEGEYRAALRTGR